MHRVDADPLLAGQALGDLPNLLTYFKHRITKATAEGSNSKIQMVKIMACGYRSRDHYRAAIYFPCGGLGLFPRPAVA